MNDFQEWYEPIYIKRVPIGVREIASQAWEAGQKKMVDNKVVGYSLYRHDQVDKGPQDECGVKKSPRS